MTKYSAIVVDDEPLLRRELRQALADVWPELTIVGEFGDGAAALQAIEESHPAISFIDIRMPRLSGLEVAERVQGSTQVVFVTAYDEHAVAAFEQGAVDYLLKPVKPTRLAATVQRLKDRLASTPAQRTQGRPWLQRIQATLGHTLRFFPVSSIQYFRSDGKYTRLVTSDAEALIRRSLAALLDDLDPEVFWQINRGIVVNLEHIDAVIRHEAGEMIVRVRDSGSELPISKTHQSRFRGM
jgi:DNA-binding LytR/AlgR family response regulator